MVHFKYLPLVNLSDFITRSIHWWTCIKLDKRNKIVFRTT